MGYSTAVRITQADIAQELGISLVTVSRALNGKGYVSEEMKRRILDYAKEKRYVPHRASQVLVRNKTRHLALFSSSLPSYFWDEIRKGIDLASDYIRAFDFDVRYENIPDYDTEAYVRAIRSSIEAGADALALVNQPPVFDMDAVYDAARDSGLPYVSFNVDYPERRGLCYIGSNYVAGGRLAAEVIATALRGYHEPAVLVAANAESRRNDPARVNLNTDRLAGFMDVMRSRFPGIRCDVQYIETDLKKDARNSYIVELLQERRAKVQAVYLIPAMNPSFLDALEKAGYRDTINIVHDLDPSATRDLDRHLVTAVIHQNPILQGYYAVRTLEHIVEASVREPIEPIEIASNVIYSENMAAARNFFDFVS